MSCARALRPAQQLQLQCGTLACCSRSLRRTRRPVCVVQETKEREAKTAEEITEKYGLEFGLWKVFNSKEEEEGAEGKKSRTAKELLAKYGSAYLAISISLSLVSFALCYLLISAGADVQELLAKVSIFSMNTFLTSFVNYYASIEAKCFDLTSA
uniref:DUF1279 domain-containing protein n=1 Tax=Zea mays TaxID=4577 RepID=A0A804RMJ9_MAIZE